MARSKRQLQKWVAGTAILLAISGLVYWALIPSVPNPVYKGKRLSYWYKQLPVVYVGSSSAGPASVLIFQGGSNTVFIFGTQGGSTMKAKAGVVRMGGATLFTNASSISERPEDAVAAIRGIGSNAVPFLMAKLRTQDSPLKMQLQKWAFKMRIKKALFEYAAVERGRAAGALLYVSLTGEARAELGRIATNKTDTNLAFMARIILSNNSPTASANPDNLDLTFPTNDGR